MSRYDQLNEAHENVLKRSEEDRNYQDPHPFAARETIDCADALVDERFLVMQHGSIISESKSLHRQN